MGFQRFNTKAYLQASSSESVIPTAQKGGSIILSFSDVRSGLLSMQIQHESRNVANKKRKAQRPRIELER